MKKKTITIRVEEDLYSKFVSMAESQGVNLSNLARKAIDDVCYQVSSERIQTSSESHQDVEWYRDQLSTRDQQIEKLQSALDQSQQLQAMTEKRYEAEHQQLIEMKARSFWQKLTSVFE